MIYYEEGGYGRLEPLINMFIAAQDEVWEKLRGPNGPTILAWARGNNYRDIIHFAGVYSLRQTTTPL